MSQFKVFEIRVQKTKHHHLSLIQRRFLAILILVDLIGVAAQQKSTLPRMPNQPRPKRLPQPCPTYKGQLGTKDFTELQGTMYLPHTSSHTWTLGTEHFPNGQAARASSKSLTTLGTCKRLMGTKRGLSW